jgi:hypothetical protein
LEQLREREVPEGCLEGLEGVEHSESPKVMQRGWSKPAILLTTNIIWTNQSSLIAILSQYDLYLIFVKNGLRMSWPMFSGACIDHYGRYLDSGQIFNRFAYGPSVPTQVLVQD